MILAILLEIKIKSLLNNNNNNNKIKKINKKYIN